MLICEKSCKTVVVLLCFCTVVVNSKVPKYLRIINAEREANQPLALNPLENGREKYSRKDASVARFNRAPYVRNKSDAADQFAANLAHVLKDEIKEKGAIRRQFSFKSLSRKRILVPATGTIASESSTGLRFGIEGSGILYNHDLCNGPSCSFSYRLVNVLDDNFSNKNKWVKAQVTEHVEDMIQHKVVTEPNIAPENWTKHEYNTEGTNKSEFVILTKKCSHVNYAQFMSSQISSLIVGSSWNQINGQQNVQVLAHVLIYPEDGETYLFCQDEIDAMQNEVNILRGTMLEPILDQAAFQMSSPQAAQVSNCMFNSLKTHPAENRCSWAVLNGNFYTYLEIPAGENDTIGQTMVAGIRKLKTAWIQYVLQPHKKPHTAEEIAEKKFLVDSFYILIQAQRIGVAVMVQESKNVFVLEYAYNITSGPVNWNCRAETLLESINRYRASYFPEILPLTMNLNNVAELPRLISRDVTDSGFGYIPFTAAITFAKTELKDNGTIAEQSLTAAQLFVDEIQNLCERPFSQKMIEETSFKFPARNDANEQIPFVQIWNGFSTINVVQLFLTDITEVKFRLIQEGNHVIAAIITNIPNVDVQIKQTLSLVHACLQSPKPSIPVPKTQINEIMKEEAKTILKGTKYSSEIQYRHDSFSNDFATVGTCEMPQNVNENAFRLGLSLSVVYHVVAKGKLKTLGGLYFNEGKLEDAGLKCFSILIDEKAKIN